MWNLKSLEVLKPYRGTAENYDTSKPGVAYPVDKELLINQEFTKL
jgi:hypothetical protein